MTIELRLLNTAGTQTHVLPDVESLTLSPVFCDAGAIEFSYPADGINFDQIRDKDEFSVAVYIDGERQAELDSLIKDVDGDDAEDSSVWKFTGFQNNGRLAEAITYPPGWPNAVDPAQTKLKFLNASAGTIIRTLMQQAQARGALSGIDYSSFTSSVDSNGTPWNLEIDIEYAPGVDYLTVFQNLVAQRMVEFKMVGMSLRAYVAGAMATDRTTTSPPLVFRRGRDLTDSPRKLSTRNVATSVLVAGSEGIYREVADNEAIAARRRIESNVSNGNVSDEGTLLVFGQASVNQTKAAKMEKTHGLAFADPDSPRPLKNFVVGDWAYSDMGRGLERLRIKQWVIKLSSKGDLTGSVTLNDFFAEQAEVLARRIQGIVGGSTITGASTATERVPDGLVDNLAPMTPQGLTVTSEAYVTTKGDGSLWAQASASWLAVTQNADGTILEDLGRYAVRFRYPLRSSTQWYYVPGTTDPSLSWDALIPGEEMDVQVRAEDRVGNASPWSASFNLLTGFDVTPPPVPSVPKVTNYLGLIRVEWDGLFLNGATQPKDFNLVEVHVSSVNNFTPDETTKVGDLSTKGVQFVNAPYNAVRYARLISVDHTGNKSAASAIAQATTAPVVSLDIFDGAVGSAKLADLAVTRAKINDLAVNSAKIGEVSAGKISAGIMAAEVTLSGRIATALTANRVEMNSLGLQAWNASNVRTFWLDSSTGNVDAVGIFRSGFQNDRSVIMTSNLNAATAAAGKASNESGLVFRSVYLVDRYSQIYDNGTSLVLDSPAFTDTSGVKQLGASFALSATGIYGYTQGAGAGSNLESFTVGNNGFWRIGRAVAGQGTVYGGPQYWTVWTEGSGTQVWGKYDGEWRLGDQDVTNFASAWGLKTAWRLGSGYHRVSGNSDGTWFLGHGSDQAIYTNGNDLWIRGRNATGGGRIDIRTAHYGPVDVIVGDRDGMRVYGNFTVFNGTKNFTIPHPLDSKRDLVHAATESPWAGVEYWGEATVDKNGRVEVELPAYFDALTQREGRCVFVQAQSVPETFTASPPKGNSFVVTGPSGATFSWLVKARRADEGAAFDVEPDMTNRRPASEGPLPDPAEPSPEQGAINDSRPQPKPEKESRGPDRTKKNTQRKVKP